MVGDVFPREHELLLRLNRGVTPIGVEYVNRQGTIDLDRVLFVFTKEVESATETPHAGVAHLIHDRVGPHSCHRFRILWFLVVKEPGHVLADIQLPYVQLAASN